MCVPLGYISPVHPIWSKPHSVSSVNTLWVNLKHKGKEKVKGKEGGCQKFLLGGHLGAQQKSDGKEAGKQSRSRKKILLRNVLKCSPLPQTFKICVGRALDDHSDAYTAIYTS